MIKTILIVFIFSTASLYGQESFISIVSALSKKHVIVENVDLITEKEYSLYGTNDSATPDTILFIDEEEQALFLSSTVKIKYISPFERLDTHYKSDGSLSHSFLTKYNKNGNVIYQKQDFGEGPTATMLNSEVEYRFDQEGRIVSVLNNGKEYLNIKYKDNLIIEELSMDAGIAIMNATSEQINDTLRYDLKMDMGEEFAAIMGDEKMPKEYMDLVIEDGLYCYYYFKENTKAQNTDLQSVHIYDKDLVLIQEKVRDYTGEMNHVEYKYDEAGALTELINHNDETSLEWIYDAKGNVLIEYIDGIQHAHSYNDQGNITQSILRVGTEGKINTLKLKEYQYKNSSNSGTSDEK